MRIPNADVPSVVFDLTQAEEARDGVLSALLSTSNRGTRFVLLSLLMRVNVFTHDNGIINHDPKHQNKGEQGKQINADAQPRHHPKRTKKAHCQTKAHP